VKDHPHATRLACLALIALGYFVAAISVYINIKNGQRLSIDDDGYYSQGGLLFAIATAPVLLSSVAANITATGWWRALQGGMLATAVFLMALSGWQSFSFMSDQTLGKVKLSEMKAKSAKDIAELENQTAIQERKELREMAMRTYLQAKSKEGKEQSLADIERITGKPLSLVAPSVEIAVADARAAMAQKLLGWDKDSVHGLSVALVALVAAFIEVGGPWAGFILWPSRQQGHHSKGSQNRPYAQRLSETFRKPSKKKGKDVKEKAKKDILTETEPLHQEAWAKRWGVSTGMASKWLKEWRKDGTLKHKRYGRRHLHFAPRIKATHANGSSALRSQIVVSRHESGRPDTNAGESQ